MGVGLDRIAPLQAAGVDPIRTADGTVAFVDALARRSLPLQLSVS